MSTASGDKNTMLTKIFVGGLPYQTTDDSLKAFFSQFGDIDEAVVIMDRLTGKSKGYGFVTMADKESADRACFNPNPIIDGRKANVNLAWLGAKPRSFPYIHHAAMMSVMGAGATVQPTPSQLGYGTNTIPGPTSHLGYGVHQPVQYAVLAPNGFVSMLPGSVQNPGHAYPTGLPTSPGLASVLTENNPAMTTTKLDDSSNSDSLTHQQQQLQRYTALYQPAVTPLTVQKPTDQPVVPLAQPHTLYYTYTGTPIIGRTTLQDKQQ